MKRIGILFIVFCIIFAIATIIKSNIKFKKDECVEVEKIEETEPILLGYGFKYHRNNYETIAESSEIEETTENKYIYIGEFMLTAYCSCHKCCDEYADNRPIDENGNEIVYGAIGEVLTEGYSVAVDPKVIPCRTEVLIDGNVYKAQDCGGAIKGNRIDVYFNDHDRANEFGVQYKDVYIIGDMS